MSELHLHRIVFSICENYNKSFHHLPLRGTCIFTSCRPVKKVFNYRIQAKLNKSKVVEKRALVLP